MKTIEKHYHAARLALEAVRAVRAEHKTDRYDQLPRDLRCPVCGFIKLEPRRWTYTDAYKVMCISCSRRLPKKVCNRGLKNARGFLSIAEAAEICGWPRQMWHRLEAGRSNTMQLKTALIIAQNFEWMPGLLRRSEHG